jgi:hypothetical protein
MDGKVNRIIQGMIADCGSSIICSSDVQEPSIERIVMD